MQSTSALNAISTNAQPKLPITHASTAFMTRARFAGARRPHATNTRIRSADPQKTAGSMPRRRRFTLTALSSRPEIRSRKGAVKVQFQGRQRDHTPREVPPRIRPPRSRGARLHDAERQQLAPRRPNLDLGVHLRADAAVVARRPPAVLDLDVGVRVDGVLPVLPEPVLVQARVEVVPGQHLGVVALPGGVPVEVDGGAGEPLVRGGHPAVVGEVLGPAVEAAARAPYLLDDPADPTVTAGEQSLDDPGAAVVVAEPDRPPVPLVGADVLAELAEPFVGGLVVELRGPLERRVRLRHEAADRDGAPDVVAAGDLATLGDHLLREVRDLEDVLVGLGRQAAHEVELD